ncbi:MAG: hypothetical protein IJP31_08420 [Lachnospiraceae bacterium]|nr:hypothetical protein [Lachnospiraceae bacterium]
MTNPNNETNATRKPVGASHHPEEMAAANREHKSTVFAMLYEDRERLLSLYNALNHSHYEDPDELVIVTLKNAIYMAMKNDVAFVLDHRLNLYEHQSTPNANMPLRDLFYVSREYEKMVTKRSLYAGKKVSIPAPRFVVFYNGSEKQPERQILKLSDLYTIREDDPMLELKVEFFNINKGFNQELKEACQSLKEYMLFVERIREYSDQKELPLNEAVDRAVRECIKEGILAEFLEENRREVVSMSIFEYDEEKEMRLLREAYLEEGYERGEAAGEQRRKEKDLKVLVDFMKKYLPDAEAVFQEIISTEEFRDCTREQIMELYEN